MAVFWSNFRNSFSCSWTLPLFLCFLDVLFLHYDLGVRAYNKLSIPCFEQVEMLVLLLDKTVQGKKVKLALMDRRLLRSPLNVLTFEVYEHVVKCLSTNGSILLKKLSCIVFSERHSVHFNHVRKWQLLFPAAFSSLLEIGSHTTQFSYSGRQKSFFFSESSNKRYPDVDFR